MVRKDAPVTRVGALRPARHLGAGDGVSIASFVPTCVQVLQCCRLSLETQVPESCFCIRLTACKKENKECFAAYLDEGKIWQ